MKPTHFLLGIVMVFGLIFELIPNPSEQSAKVDLFLFHDMEMAWQWYAYFTMEHVALIVLASLIPNLHRDNVVKWFFILQVAQLADFWLTYNTTWFHIGLLPVSMNIAQIITFIAVVISESVKDGRGYT